MPQRFLRPGLTTSPRFNAVDWISQSFYVRLLTLVDDYGRYDASLRLLRSHIFPLGDHLGRDVSVIVIEKVCLQLSRAGLVQFYQTAEGQKLLQVLRWQERARSESKFPPFSDNNCEQMFANDSKCSPPSSSSSSSSSPKPLAISHGIGGSAKQNTPTPAVDEEKVWREQIAADPAYSHIRVSDEFGKMLRWCEVNKKQATRRRFINWLNRIEKPCKAFPGSRKAKAKSPEPVNQEKNEQYSPDKIAERQKMVRELSEKLYPPMTAAEEGGRM